MARRSIGIDIGSSHVRAAQIARSGDQFLVEKVFSAQTRRSTDSRPDILRSLIDRHGFDRRAEIAVSIPDEAVFFRTLQSDSAPSEQLPAAPLPDLDHDFPIPPTKNVTHVCSQATLSDHRHFALVAVASRPSLQQRLGLLAAAKMRPRLLEPPVFAIHSVVAMNHPEIMSGTAVIAAINGPFLTLAVTNDGSVLIVRNILLADESDNSLHLVKNQVADLLAEEAAITWQRIFGYEINNDVTIYLVTGARSLDGLETLVADKLCCRTVVVDPYARVKRPLEQNGDGAMYLAQGLALGALAAGETRHVNFLEAANLETEPKVNLKRDFLTCAVLAAVIALVALVGLFTRLSHLEDRYAQVKNEIKQTFHAALPEETNIVNPLAQLEQKLQLLRANRSLFGYICGADAGPLEILRTITSTVPAQADINISNMLITTQSARLTGTSPSFDAVYNWQRRLQEVSGFSVVDPHDLRKDPGSGRINFTISISLAPPE